MKMLGRDAPRMRIVALPVTFRNVGESLLERRIDAAVTVADELASSIHRRALVRGNLTCLFDPRYAAPGKARRLTERAYFEHEQRHRLVQRRPARR